MQLSLNLGVPSISTYVPRKRVQVVTTNPETDTHQCCEIELDQLNWQQKYRLLKDVLKTMELTGRKEVKATFYFEEETKVELPHHFKQLKAEWVKVITLKLVDTPSGLWVSKLKNKKTGRSMYDFPLQHVVQVRLETLEKASEEQQSLASLWRRKHLKLWTHLTLEELSTYLPEVETLEVSTLFSRDDLEYAEGCFEWQDPFELRTQTTRQQIKAIAQNSPDGHYRTWILVKEPRARKLKRYLWLNPSEALLYQEERY